jgi:hypothetical protein
VRIIQRPVSAALVIVLGVVVLVVGASLLMLRDGGWPWHAGIGGPAGAGTTIAEIVEEDGTLHRFSGSPAETQAWLDRTQEELKDAYGIPTKIAAGWVLAPVGLTLMVLGLVRLLRTYRR